MIRSKFLLNLCYNNAFFSFMRLFVLLLLSVSRRTRFSFRGVRPFLASPPDCSRSRSRLTAALDPPHARAETTTNKHGRIAGPSASKRGRVATAGGVTRRQPARPALRRPRPPRLLTRRLLFERTVLCAQIPLLPLSCPPRTATRRILAPLPPLPPLSSLSPLAGRAP